MYVANTLCQGIISRPMQSFLSVLMLVQLLQQCGSNVLPHLYCDSQIKLRYCSPPPHTHTPVITVQVTPSSSGPLTAGQTGFSLSCDVSGTDNLNSPSFTYQWRKDDDVIADQQGRTLSLSPLTASNAGQYICEVTVTSTSLSRPITIISNVHDVSIQSKSALYSVMYSPRFLSST